MRKLTPRDMLATLITRSGGGAVRRLLGARVDAVCADPRRMAGVVIVGTVLVFAVFGRNTFATGAFEMVMLGVLTLGFALAALIAETVWALLVPAMAGHAVARPAERGRKALARQGWGGTGWR